MSDWIPESSVLHLITIFIVFSAALNRNKHGNLQWIINTMVIAVALPLQSTTGGLHGVMTGLFGAGAAALLAIPLYRSRWMTRVDIFTTCVTGMLMGPIHFTLAYGIATGFIIIQHALKARTAFISERLFQGAPFYSPAPYRGSASPSLIEMESHRMLDDDSRNGIPFGESRAPHGGEVAPWIVPASDEVLPWSGNIALATIAVLMLGIPW